jgi:inorganic triphosphatase YgiF
VTAPLPLDAADLESVSRELDRYDASISSFQAVAQARAALSLRDELAALVGELAECKRVHQSYVADYGGNVSLNLELAECRAKLAQSQARERELREALEEIADANGCEVEGCTNRNCVAGRRAKAALARPADDSALREMLKRYGEMVEDSIARGDGAKLNTHATTILGGGK